jgi:hypothetical protein
MLDDPGHLPGRPAESLWFQIEKDGKLRFLAHSPNWPSAGLTGGSRPSTADGKWSVWRIDISGTY